MTVYRTRKGIPFFHDKTESEFQKDVYERYDEMVIRQSALHLADEFWYKYPFQSVIDFAEKHYPLERENNILELGCGVGRWIASLAQKYPKSNCWGIDYSYQMLKRAKEYWVDGKEITIDLSKRGLGVETVIGKKISNLNFGLAKAENLPFDDNSQDLILSSFLIDRLADPEKGLTEMFRVLNAGGKLIVVTPLNFDNAAHWKLYYPPSQIAILLEKIGFEILAWKEDIVVDEPLDGHGNNLHWNCLGFVVGKNRCM